MEAVRDCVTFKESHYHHPCIQRGHVTHPDVSTHNTSPSSLHIAPPSPQMDPPPPATSCIQTRVRGHVTHPLPPLAYKRERDTLPIHHHRSHPLTLVRDASLVHHHL